MCLVILVSWTMTVISAVWWTSFHPAAIPVVYFAFVAPFDLEIYKPRSFHPPKSIRTSLNLPNHDTWNTCTVNLSCSLEKRLIFLLRMICEESIDL